MALISQVKGALYVAAQDVAVTLGLPIALPGISFDPPNSGWYLRAKVFPNAPAWQGLSSGRMDQGLLQIDVVAPPGVGEIEHTDRADDVIAAFPLGSQYAGGGESIVTIIGQPWQVDAISEDTGEMIPVTIPWMAA